MMIGHLPAGYILGKLFQRWLPDKVSRRKIMTVSMVGSVLPDVDMIYFYGVDRSVSHHLFYSHIPAVFCFLLPLAILFFCVAKTRTHSLLTLVLWATLMLHAILDTTVEGILWTYPFCERTSINLINWSDKSTIPHICEPLETVWAFGNITIEGWMINVMSHWTFLLEIATIMIAAFVFWFTSRRKA